MNNRKNSNNNNPQPPVQFPTHMQPVSRTLSSDQINQISLMLADSKKKSAELSRNLPTSSQQQQMSAWVMQRAKLLSEAGNKASEIARADRDLREASQSMSTTRIITTTSLSPLTGQTQVAVQDNNKRQKIDSSSQRQIFTNSTNFNSRSVASIFTIQNEHRTGIRPMPLTFATTTTTTTTTSSEEESTSLIESATDLQENPSSNKTNTKRGSSFELCDENGKIFYETATLTYHINDKGSYFTTEDGRKIIYQLYFDEQDWITNNNSNKNLVKSVPNPKKHNWVDACTEDMSILSVKQVFTIKCNVRKNVKDLFFYIKNGESRQLLNQASQKSRSIQINPQSPTLVW